MIDWLALGHDCIYDSSLSTWILDFVRGYGLSLYTFEAVPTIPGQSPQKVGM